jgi:dienelactone hydrolase
MVEVVLFHSILGSRQAEREIAAVLEGDGHRVIVPDLYHGERAEDYDEGFRIHDRIGQDTLVERANAALAEASEEAVLAGVSFGAFLIGSLWSQRLRMPGALLLCGFTPWMTPRRPALPVSAHIARPDPFDSEEDFAAWERAADGVALELHRYDEVGHYFLDRSLPGYNEGAATLCMGRARAFLASLTVGG